MFKTLLNLIWGTKFRKRRAFCPKLRRVWAGECQHSINQQKKWGRFSHFWDPLILASTFCQHGVRLHIIWAKFTFFVDFKYFRHFPRVLLTLLWVWAEKCRPINRSTRLLVTHRPDYFLALRPSFISSSLTKSNGKAGLFLKLSVRSVQSTWKGRESKKG